MCLRKYNICVKAFLLDGTDDHEKVETYQSRRNGKLKESEKLWNNGFKGKSIFISFF